MMKKHGFLIALVLGYMLQVGSLLAQSPPYQKVFQYVGEAESMSRGSLIDSGQAVVGLGFVTDDRNVPLLVRFGLDGDPVWQRAPANGPIDKYHWECLGIEGDGIFVGGLADGDSSSAGIMRFDHSGNPTWSRIFSYNAERMSITALSGDHQGNVAFGGQVADTPDMADGMVGKIRASDGLPLWMSTIDDSLGIRVQALATTPSGEVVAAGNQVLSPGLVVLKPWIAKWSATGSLLWCKLLDYYAVIRAMQVSADAIYIAGDDYDNGNFTWACVGKFSHTGTLLRWKSMTNPGESSYFKDVKLDGDGLALVGAHQANWSATWNGLVMRMDTALQPVYAWVNEFVQPEAVTGADANGMLHFLGRHFLPSTGYPLMAHGAIPDLSSSSIPCGMNHHFPIFTSMQPPVVPYPVTVGSTNRSGYASTNTLAPQLTLFSSCVGTSLPSPTMNRPPWPNPTTGWLHLPLPDEMTDITLLSADGREVLRAAGIGETAVDLSGVPAGMYLLRVGTAADVWTTKVVKVD